MELITDYILRVKEQNQTNPDFPKFSSLSYSNFSPTYTPSQAITYILTENYNYLSVVRINSYYYWEFVSTTNTTEFKDHKFIYLQVTDSNLKLLEDKLPCIYQFSKDSYIELIRPHKLYLLDTNSNDWGAYYQVTLSDLYTHPFLPTFYFSGRSSLLKNKLLYEYVDAIGLYGIRDFTYLSPLRPTNLNFPLGDVSLDDLQLDDCFNFSFPTYPQEGTSDFVGRYSGYYTNSTFSKHIRFWLYQRSDSSVFLLDSPPTLSNNCFITNC